MSKDFFDILHFRADCYDRLAEFVARQLKTSIGCEVRSVENDCSEVQEVSSPESLSGPELENSLVQTESRFQLFLKRIRESFAQGSSKGERKKRVKKDREPNDYIYPLW
jgi:hypothetical protein